MKDMWVLISYFYNYRDIIRTDIHTRKHKILKRLNLITPENNQSHC